MVCCSTDKCVLKETCPGSEYCWGGDCCMKEVYDSVTEKAPSYTFANYRNILKAFAQGRNIFLTAQGGCLTGDTVIRYNRASLGRKATIKHLYEANKGIAKCKKWDKTIKTKVRSYIKDKNCIMLNDIEDIVYSGKKEVYLLSLEDGKTLKATSDHKIMTNDGFVELRDLKVGNLVMVDNIVGKRKKSEPQQKKPKLKDKRIQVGKYHPYAKIDISHRWKTPNYSYRVEIHRAIYEASMNNMSLEDFCRECKQPNNLKFINTKTHCIHHIDKNHYNNDINNLALLTRKEHNKLHGNYKAFGYGIPEYSRVQSIEYVGIEDTYDICCYENHNFNANDIIVHNSGKSFLLNQLRNALPGKIIVTATTGVAALNISGATVHSALGLGLGKKPVNSILKGLSKYKLDFLNNMQILAIDEVSMLSGELLNKINEFLKVARMDSRPFGGVQVILIGDFCQLPPVDTENQTKDYCFYSYSWQEANLACFELKHNFRQQDDPHYANILKELRMGRINQDAVDLIKSRQVEIPSDVPRLYATNKEVKIYNYDKLVEIGNDIKTFKAYYTCPNEKIKNNKEFYNSLVEKMKKDSIFEDELSLCEESRVMLTTNLDLGKGLVNGSLGHIDSFCESDGTILVKFDNGEERWVKKTEREMVDAQGNPMIVQTQYPLKLASAISVHRSQGCTLEKVFIDFDRFFEVNQAYVALSRVKTSKGLYVKNFKLSALKFAPQVLDFYGAKI